MWSVSNRNADGLCFSIGGSRFGGGFVERDADELDTRAHVACHLAEGLRKSLAVGAGGGEELNHHHFALIAGKQRLAARGIDEREFLVLSRHRHRRQRTQGQRNRENCSADSCLGH